METYVRVALKIAHNNGIFTYRLKHEQPGRDFFGLRVRVYFRNRPLLGVIIGHEPEDFDPGFQVKDIEALIDDQPILSSSQFALMNFCARYYFNDLGMCVHLAVPRNEKPWRTKGSKTKPIIPQNMDLSAEQQAVLDAILGSPKSAFLLEGVTGSGKTHVYIKAALDTLAKDRSVLFLVPEISLTPQLIKRVQEGLGIKALVIHSHMTPAQKKDSIFAVLNGAKVLIGARSAVFAPLSNLGLIVVDEEHDSSFKQDEAPRYHARDLAVYRGKEEGATVILGSATPSLESSLNVIKGRFIHLKLATRFQKARLLPQVSVIDLKERAADVDFRTQDLSASSGQKMCILSRPLVNAMRETVKNGQQVILFLNQRGYARFGVCYQCGAMVSCPNCSIGLTYYQKRNSLTCHQCHHQEKAFTTCRSCLNESVRYVGLGTERLEEEVRLLMPDARVMRLDRDIVQSQKRLEQTLSAMHDRTADILIGTQMIAKGHDFLHVTLVGVVLADVALSMPDFRAAEKTFQLLTQVSGRAGRGEISGNAIIQTFDPAHPSIRFAKEHDVEAFTKAELSLRKRFEQPPFVRAALIRCEHPEEEVAEEIIGKAHSLLAKSQALKILGPAPSPIERLNNRFRFQCLAFAKSASLLHQSLCHMRADKELEQHVHRKKARLIIDVDPQHMS